MAFMIMQRDFVVRANGHSIGFTAGKEQWVPPECHSEAMKFGAVPVDKKAKLNLEKAPERPKVVSGADRDVAMFDACVYLKSKNSTSDFGANGLPKVKALCSIVGFDVSSVERDKAWRDMMALEQAKKVPGTNDS